MISSRNCTLQQSSVNCRDQCVHRECHCKIYRQVCMSFICMFVVLHYNSGWLSADTLQAVDLGLTLSQTDRMMASVSTVVKAPQLLQFLAIPQPTGLSIPMWQWTLLRSCGRLVCQSAGSLILGQPCLLPWGQRGLTASFRTVPAPQFCPQLQLLGLWAPFPTDYLAYVITRCRCTIQRFILEVNIMGDRCALVTISCHISTLLTTDYDSCSR